MVAKQQRVIDGGVVEYAETTPTNGQKPLPRAPTPSSSSKTSKTIADDTLEELVKGLRDLRVEMSELRKIQRPESYRTIDRPRPFVKRCTWCDETDHERKDCTSYAEAIKSGLVCFKEGRIRMTSTDESLSTNFGRGGMK